VTGEVLKHEVVRRWFALYPDITLVNAYGATRGLRRHDARNPRSGSDAHFVTVGRPRRNVNTYVLNEHLRLVPRGAPGEIVSPACA